MKYVRFNLSLAEFQRGQIIPYHELKPGQKFWVDNEDILGNERIAHFCDEEGKIIEGEALDKLADDVGEEIVDEIVDEPVVEEDAPEVTEDTETTEVLEDSEGQEEVESDDAKELDFDFEKNEEEVIDEAGQDDQSKTVVETTAETSFSKCLGVKADGSKCNNKAGQNGYCFRHIDQAE